MDELKLCLVTDGSQRTDLGATSRRALVATVTACVGAGLPSVQLREKDLTALELATLARALRAATEPSAWLIVNDRVDVALATGADAVQRTSTSLGIHDIRVIAGSRLRIGASVHSREEAVDAEAAGADWVTFGPVYDTPSKRRYGAPQGLAKLEAVAKAVRVPVVAIGGITPSRVTEARAAGAYGVAVISAILAAASPPDATREFLEALDKAR